MSTVLGARSLGSGDAGDPVWVARHDLAAGLELRTSDLEVRQVHVAGSGRQYVAAASPLAGGFIVTRAIGAGELVPSAAVSAVGSVADQRVVTIEVQRFHAAENLARGERVDVYVTPRGGSGDVRAPVLLGEGVDVVDVEEVGGRFGSSGATRGIAVSVTASAVPLLVGGIGRGTVDLVRIPQVHQ